MDTPYKNTDKSGNILDIIGKSARTVSKGTPTAGKNQFGKIPPQARDLEEAILGALMLEKDALSAVIDILKPEIFYSEANQLIFKSIQKLFEISEPVDILTVTQQLRKMGSLEKVGGAMYISELTNRVGSAANIEYHARIIQQKYIMREMIRIAGEVERDAYEETTDVFDLLDTTEKQLFSVAEGNIRRSYDDMATIIAKSIKQIEALKDKEDGLSGVPSGLRELDRITSGWQPSNLIIIAARPAMGKSALVLSMARNAAVDYGQGVAVFSLEMSAIELVNRLISAEAELDAEKLKKGTLADHEWVQLNHRITPLTKAPIFIDDTPGLNIFELRAKCRRLKSQHNIQMIIIDYLQLMTAGGERNNNGNREQEIASISRALKNLAKELEIPVIALSQLSRAVETRGGDKKPMLSDLRESGSIEQDADMVMFIYRPEYYKITEDNDGRSLKGVAQILVAKHRNGAIGEVNLRFTDRFAKFSNLDNIESFRMDEPQPARIDMVVKGSKLGDGDLPPFDEPPPF
jgi:replicative DNA helicase